MPKTAPGKVYRRTYSQEDLDKAIDMLRSGEILYTVSKVCHVPYNTLKYKWEKVKTGDTQYAEIKTGHLSPSIESQLVAWILESFENGAPVSYIELKLAVMNHCDKYHGKKCYLHNKVPSVRFMKRFTIRHPEVNGKLIHRDGERLEQPTTANLTTAWTDDDDDGYFYNDQQQNIDYVAVEDLNPEMVDIKCEPCPSPPPIEPSAIDEIESLKVENYMKLDNLPSWISSSKYSQALDEVKNEWTRSRGKFMQSLKCNSS